MKNLFPRTALLFISTTVLPALPISAMAADRLERFDLEFNLGTRVDQLDWNIAGDINGTDPNIISELIWEDLAIAEVSTKARIIVANDHFPLAVGIRGGGSYGEILNGRNYDSDYELDNRTNEWSRSSNKADNGEVWDFTAGAGPVFRSRDRKIVVFTLVGYSFHAQNLTIHDGYQTISKDNPFTSSHPGNSTPPVGPISGLNSTYDTEWRSGWVGVDLEFQSTPKIQLHASVELHAGEFMAEANWNLRSDLNHPKSFAHDSDEATGIVTGVGTTFSLGRMLLNLNLNYQKWQAQDGVDRTYYSDGTSSVIRLNEVNWESLSVSAGLVGRF